MIRKVTSIERKKFEEERARRILLEYFPHKFIESELSERPDIINLKESVGVEVTDAQLQSVQQGLSRSGILSWEKEYESRVYAGSATVMLKERAGIHTLRAYYANTYDFSKAYGKKLMALNKEGYQRFCENDLFIFAWLADECSILSFIEEIRFDPMQFYTPCRTNKQAIAECVNGTAFDFLYLFTENSLYEYSMKNQKMNRYDIKQQQINRITEESFEAIMGMNRADFFSA